MTRPTDAAAMLQAASGASERRLVEEADAFEALLVAVEQRRAHPERDAFPARYRRLCLLLARARHRSVRPSLVERLNDLALRGHAALYRPLDRRDARQRVPDLLLRRFPATLRARPGPFALATALYVLSFALSFALIRAEPSRVFTVLGPETAASLEAMYASPEALRGGRPADTDVAMFGYYIRNNVGIDLRTFGAGAIACVGTLFVLLFNGIFHGAVFAHLHNANLGHVIDAFAIGHSSFELVGMVVAGAAGLRVGLALLVPGQRTRLLALRQETAAVMPLVWGFLTMTSLAAFVEAFWSSSAASPTVRYAVGTMLWIAVLRWISGGEASDAS